MTRRGWSARGSALDAAGGFDAVHPGHAPVEVDDVDTAPGRARRCVDRIDRRVARRQPRRQEGHAPQHVRRGRARGALSSTTSARRPRRSALGTRSGLRAAAPRRAVNQKVLPLPARFPRPPRRPSARPASCRSPGPGRCRRTCGWSRCRPARSSGTAARSAPASGRCRCRAPRSAAAHRCSPLLDRGRGATISPFSVNLTALLA